MLTNFDIKNTKNDNDTIERFSKYIDYKNLYDGDFSRAFSSTVLKIQKRYPLDNTTAQSLININLFWALTDFFKGFLTNQGININVDDAVQSEWDRIAKENNFISVLKEVYIDNSRYGNGIFKVALKDDEPKIFSISPDCWIPVFNNGDLNDVAGHILLYPMETVENGVTKKYKKVEKHHRGYVENEVWTFDNGVLGRMLDPEELEEMGVYVSEDFSAIWDGFLVFPAKNTTESDVYFGESDYKRCKSIVEEIMLTISQNSKIINRHANPKMSGSEQNLEYNPVSGERVLPDADFLKVGTDGVKPEYITVNLQSEAIEKHVNMLMQFFYILTKTPPQAYGLEISGNMSGESLRKIFIAALSKVDDIKQVSFNSVIQEVVECALAFNFTPSEDVQIAWGEPIPCDYSETVNIENSRVAAGTQSKLTTIMTIDNVSEDDARLELERIEEEKAPKKEPEKPVQEEAPEKSVQKEKSEEKPQDGKASTADEKAQESEDSSKEE